MRKNHWKMLGPGLTTGAADDDPSGIATYSQIGASRGFGLISLSAVLLPLMGVVQEMCARIGLSTGVGLAANIKRHYSKKTLLFLTGLLFFANVFNIGADLGAMAASAELLFPYFDFALGVIFFALLSLFLQIHISYKKYSKYLKYLSMVLAAYVLSAVAVGIDWGEAARNIAIPAIRFDKEEIILIAAAIGTTISPYLFFWQTSQEVEEQISRGERTEKERREKNTAEDIREMRVDVWSGMVFSNMIMFFIIAACAATLFQNGITNIATASDAAMALRPFAGDFAYSLFAIGVVGTGLLAIPVLAGSSSYAISECFGWKEGLYRKWKQASAFYGVIILAMILGIILNFTGLDPIKSLIYSAVANGIISPVILFFILRIASREDVMGRFKNGILSNATGWATLILLSASSALSIYFIFS